MDLPERLVNQEKAISDLSHKIQYYQESHYFKRRKVPSLEAELTDKKEKQVNAVASFLEKEFAPFRELVEGNYTLLKGCRIKLRLLHADFENFIPCDNASAVTGGRLVSRIKGDMNQNGYLYGHVITNRHICQNFLYVHSLKGKIGYLGMIRFIRSGTKKGLKGVPRTLSGIISNRGITNLEVVGREHLLHEHIYRNIVANAFVDNEEKRDQFVRNRNELYSIIEDTRKLLREVSNSE